MILIALGSNLPGRWGTPIETIERAVTELRRAHVDVVAVSGIYATAGIGPGRASIYANAVLLAHSPRAPDALLSVLKRIERDAGRRTGRRWGPRVLDLDILDYKGQIRGRGTSDSSASVRRTLVLPHPQLHLRPFVLLPLLDIAPRWRHPILKRSADTLWRGIRSRSAGRVLEQVRPPVP